MDESIHIAYVEFSICSTYIKNFKYLYLIDFDMSLSQERSNKRTDWFFSTKLPVQSFFHKPNFMSLDLTADIIIVLGWTYRRTNRQIILSCFQISPKVNFMAKLNFQGIPFWIYRVNKKLFFVQWRMNRRTDERTAGSVSKVFCDAYIRFDL